MEDIFRSLPQVDPRSEEFMYLINGQDSGFILLIDPFDRSRYKVYDDTGRMTESEENQVIQAARGYGLIL